MKPGPHNLPLHTLLPLRGLVITLQCIDNANIQFFHQPSMCAFLRFLAGSPDGFENLIRFDAPESGRVAYRAGDLYRFLLIGLNGSDELLELILSKLATLPLSAPKKQIWHSFRDNWKLHSVYDMQNSTPISSVDESSQYDVTQLKEEAELWQRHVQIQWQWQSPARVLKPRDHRVSDSGKSLNRDDHFIRDQSDLHPALLSEGIRNTTADLLRRRKQKTPQMFNAPLMTILGSHVFFQDVHYRGESGELNHMGGLCGHIQVDVTALSRDWWELLVLGQYLGVGQRCAFGWGRYALRTHDGEQTARRIYPAVSMLHLAAETETLQRAWRHVMAGRDTNDNNYRVDDEDVDPHYDPNDEFAAAGYPANSLDTAFEKLLNGCYQPPDLCGYLIPKKSGSVRALAVPPPFDRVLQRSVQQILTPSLEQIMSGGSHGYRRGRSRLTASQSIQKAWRDGYRWVYEGDIKDFFDSVNLDRLRDRLHAVYGYNDPVVPAIMNWMHADVVFQGKRIARHRGLPQGSPLSPLMANLMLDDFDSDMETSGFLMIRFADDFVVLCKEPSEAKAAQERAQSSLQEHGLDLHPDKTRIADMQDGFRYLGYLFVNDMALDVGGTGSSDNEDAAPATNGWLVELSDREVKQATSEKSLLAIVDRIHKKSEITLGTRQTSGAFVTVTGTPAVLSTRTRQLIVTRKDRILSRQPWSSIQSMLLLGNHQITTQAMHAALNHDVSVHLATGTGRYRGCITHNRNSQHQALWMQQILTFQDVDKSLYCARQIVGSRLIHMKENLRQRRSAGKIPVIDKALRQYSKAKDLQMLLGYEGSATREYYGKIANILPDEIGFNGRNRRPPKDPFNALLSLGYTQLYSITESTLQVRGLLPWQGFYHQPRGKHAVLASDMMEPFRHLVERSALSMFTRGEVGLKDFEITGGSCKISDEARRKYIAYLMRNWSIKVKSRGQDTPLTWMEHLQGQVNSLRGFVLDGNPFQPFRLR